jgi:hypothetical protein
VNVRLVAYGVVLSAAFAAMACAQSEPLPPVHQVVRATEPRDVSILQLIGSPAEFYGARIRVVGFCDLELKDRALYLHREDFDAALFRNAVRLGLGSASPHQLLSLNRRYVLAEGTFEKRLEGGFAGELRDVSRLEVWPSREQRNPRM